MIEKELIFMAARAVVGPTQGEVIARVSDALELVDRRARTNGYAEGYRDGSANEQPVYNWWDVKGSVGC